MGRGKKGKAAAAALAAVSEDSDTDSVSSSSTALSDLTLGNRTEQIVSQGFVLDNYLDALYEKRASTRETALAALVESLESYVLLDYVENKYATLLSLFSNSIKKGSTKEACLASRAIGLLTITLGAGSPSHEIMNEAGLEICKVIQSGSDPSPNKIISLLECLAVLTFVGSVDLTETELFMKSLWDLIHPKAGAHVGASKKPVPGVQAAAISAWSFLLSTLRAWRISSENYKDAVTYLANLLESGDRTVRIAAGEALAVCFELHILDVPSGHNSSIAEGAGGGAKHHLFLHMQAMKAKILGQVDALSTEAGGKGADKKNLNDQRELFQNIYDYIKTGACPEESVKISKKVILLVSSWTELVQLNFLKRYLGRGFLPHAQGNVLLHDIFDLSVDTNENMSSQSKKVFRAGEEKERDQLMNKNRKLAQVRKQRFVEQDD